jgi:hypothetical protein
LKKVEKGAQIEARVEHTENRISVLIIHKYSTVNPQHPTRAPHPAAAAREQQHSYFEAHLP